MAGTRQVQQAGQLMAGWQVRVVQGLREPLQQLVWQQVPGQPQFCQSAFAELGNRQ